MNENALVPGCFVSVSGKPFGLAKFHSLQGGKARVEWFLGVARHESAPVTHDYSVDSLQRAVPCDQTRCYVHDEGVWRMGRVRGSSSTSAADVQLEVHIGGGGAHYFPENKVYVRADIPGRSPEDPIETLALRAQETPFFHQRRSRLRRLLSQQRALAHGLTGLISARVFLLRHQVEVVRRVLEDPVQRYLLADEVGLGKTIEAGVVVRQLLCDDPAARVLIIVPAPLRAQWQRELETKLCLPVDGERLVLLTTAQIQKKLTGFSPQDWSLVVMDEAHHIAAARRQPKQAHLWEFCRAAAHAAPRALLLSATPALNHEDDFLSMLHLLEPVAYPLDDVESFRRRVRDRAPIGRFLLSFNAPLKRAAARRALPQLRELFLNDEVLSAGADELEQHINAEEWPQEAANALARALRLRICETYRVHRRMVRTSRVRLEAGTLSGRAKTTSDGQAQNPATAEYDCDLSRLRRAHDAIDAWREAALGALSALPDTQREPLCIAFAEMFALFGSWSATWLHLLRLGVEFRLQMHGTGASPSREERAEYSLALGEEPLQRLCAAPLFESEAEVLQALLAAIERNTSDSEESGEADIVETLLESLRQVWRVQKRSAAPTRCLVVVFTSSTLVGQTLVRRLRAGSEAAASPVWSHLQSDADAKRDENLVAFGAHQGRGVLVCDRSGEEGLNFQFADLLIHFDLPWEPNRIEQRFDRIGHTGAVRSRIFAGWSGERDAGESSPSFHEAWYRVLDEGFDIFCASVADLQFLADAALPHLKRVAFEGGAAGLLAEIPRLREQIEAERESGREQAELDGIEAFEREDDEFFAGLLRADEAGQDLRVATEEWLLEGLKFVRDLPIDVEERYGTRAKERGALVSYRAVDNTLLPAEWRERLLRAQSAMPGVRNTLSYDKRLNGGLLSTFERTIACAEPPAQLLRPGTPFLDELNRLLEWDDRGQAFALWRYTASWPHAQDGFCFRFDYAIETDTRPARELLKQLALNQSGGHWNADGERALLRQADALLPPRFESLLFDLQGRFITDPLVRTIVGRRYKAPTDGRDFNLDTERLWALDLAIPRAKWPLLCRKMRKISEAWLRNHPPLQEQWAQSAGRAREEQERRLELVRNGLLLRARYGKAKKGKKVDTLRALDSCAGHYG